MGVEMPKMPKVKVPSVGGDGAGLLVKVFFVINVIGWIIGMSALASVQHNSGGGSYGTVVQFSLQWWTIWYQLMVIAGMALALGSPKFNGVVIPQLCIVTVLLSLMANQYCQAAYDNRNEGGWAQNSTAAVAAGVVFMLLGNYVYLLVQGFKMSQEHHVTASAAPAPPAAFVATYQPAPAVSVRNSASTSPAALAKQGSFVNPPPVLPATVPNLAPPTFTPQAQPSYYKSTASALAASNSSSNVNPYLVPPPSSPSPAKSSTPATPAASPYNAAASASTSRRTTVDATPVAAPAALPPAPEPQASGVSLNMYAIPPDAGHTRSPTIGTEVPAGVTANDEEDKFEDIPESDTKTAPVV